MNQSHILLLVTRAPQIQGVCGLRSANHWRYDFDNPMSFRLHCNLSLKIQFTVVINNSWWMYLHIIKSKNHVYMYKSYSTWLVDKYCSIFEFIIVHRWYKPSRYWILLFTLECDGLIFVKYTHFCCDLIWRRGHWFRCHQATNHYLT